MDLDKELVRIHLGALALIFGDTAGRVCEEGREEASKAYETAACLCTQMASSRDYRDGICMPLIRAVERLQVGL